MTEPLKAEIKGSQPRLLRLKPAAAMLSISPAALRRLIQDGQIPILRVGEHSPWLIDVHDLDRFIARKKEVLEF